MVNLYYKAIIRGEKKLSDVPAKLRPQVEALLKADEEYQERLRYGLVEP